MRGQSGTVAVIGDESGRILGRGRAGAADEIGQDAQSTRLRDALRAAYDEAAIAAKIGPDACCARIVAGISGYEGRVYGRAPEFPCGELVLLHDAVIAQAGAFEGGPGVAVIAGTGSVAYGVNAHGESVTVGGWGYLFGDEGSAFWFARRAIGDAIRDDDSGKANALGKAALEYFGSPSLHALVRSFYAGEISRTKFASSGATVIESGKARAGRGSCAGRARGANDGAYRDAGGAGRISGRRVEESGDEGRNREGAARSCAGSAADRPAPRCRRRRAAAGPQTMSDRNLLESLRGGLIVSVQARTGSALDEPNVLAAIAVAAKEAGAVAVRAAGEQNLKAIRKRVDLPIVGIVKREYPGFEPYITPTLREVREITGCGAEIVAFDATGRPRPGGVGIAGLVEEIQGAGALAMADCAAAADAVAAQAAAADIVATTLRGYTKETAAAPGADPERAAELDVVICEGGIHFPGGRGQRR